MTTTNVIISVKQQELLLKTLSKHCIATFKVFLILSIINLKIKELKLFKVPTKREVTNRTVVAQCSCHS